jgi:ssDNA-binding Zn-finger/Zn-ribbon topoisomerase 1
MKALRAAGPPARPVRFARFDAQLERERALEKALAEGRLPPCPRCEKPMVERINRRDLSRFWGCSKYPKCRGTLDVDDWAAMLGNEAAAHRLATRRAKVARRRQNQPRKE